ncbi:MAG: DUF819 family protein [Burkholderiaceae bacterium]
MIVALTACLFLLVPALVLWLVHRFGWAQKLGAIVICYALGLAAGNLGLLPSGFKPVQSMLLDGAIALALPMILLSVDVMAWTRIAGKALLSMALAVASVLVVSVALFFAWRAMGTPKAFELAGMSVGIYTGGTPNLAAIKTALGVDEARYVLFNAFDVAIGAVYLLFMVTIAQKFFLRWLPAYRPVQGPHANAASMAQIHSEDYASLLNRRGALSILQSVAVTLIVAALAMGTAALLGLMGSVAVVIALLTTFALAASFMPRVRRIEASYRAGMYLIYLFSFTVATLADFTSLSQLDFSLLLFVAVAVFASVALHALLCAVARIDVDTFLVTSMSSICSPPFVPMMARSLGNPDVLLSGITTGLIGYAVGTYLGVGLALLLKGLG